MWVPSLSQEDPLGEGAATHFSILAWRIPWTEETAGLQFMGSQYYVITHKIAWGASFLQCSWHKTKANVYKLKCCLLYLAGVSRFCKPFSWEKMRSRLVLIWKRLSSNSYSCKGSLITFLLVNTSSSTKAVCMSLSCSVVSDSVPPLGL